MENEANCGKEESEQQGNGIWSAQVVEIMSHISVGQDLGKQGDHSGCLHHVGRWPFFLG